MSVAATELAQRLTTEERFRALADSWKHESRYLSNLNPAFMFRSYQAIIGMGFPAVRLLLEEMRRQPGHWFWALEAITDANPIPEEARGNVRLMTAAWLEWGKQNGVID